MVPRCDVLLVVPPFASARWPALGVSLLQQGCRDVGLRCEIYYANLELFSQLDHDLYDGILAGALEEMVGELLFSTFAYDPHPSPPRAAERLTAHFAGRERLICYSNLPGEAPTVEQLLGTVEIAAAFLPRAVDRILATGATIFGFSSVFQQSCAAAALARGVKERSPQVVTVLGGSNAEWPMGPALLDASPVFDMVFCGESDDAFPSICADILASGRRPRERVIRCEPVLDLDRTPPPCYDSWFQQARALLGDGGWVAPRFLPFESSRGCWWGQKSHCTFCGLNANGMMYRRKSDRRILDELQSAFDRWWIQKFQAVDNIMPIEFRETLLPALAERQPPYELFYEVKSNLSDGELELFQRAGVTSIQPGIESLSTEILRLMRKGVTGRQNIALLRDCRACDIAVAWNILLGFPGESARPYREMLAVMPTMEHLEAPSVGGHIRIDRFSPYFDRASDFGVRDLEPLPVYGEIYPEGTRLDDIAYHFDGAWSSKLLEDEELLAELESAISRWRELWAEEQCPPVLRRLDRDGEIVIEDTRRCAHRRFTTLDAREDHLLLELEKPVLSARTDRTPALETLLDRRFVIEHEGYLLSLVVRQRA